VWGHIELGSYLNATGGRVVGQVLTDAKIRTYSRRYTYEPVSDTEIRVQPARGGNALTLPTRIRLDASLVAFFGLYSGDGSKGTEDPENLGTIVANISFSQREPNLIRFAIEQFRRVFGAQLAFTFSLGEDAALFMGGEGAEMLRGFYGGTLPPASALGQVRPTLNEADNRYLDEVRELAGTPSEHLAFYYQHRDAMQQILEDVKRRELASASIPLSASDRVVASLRRPFKKGARQPGGSSRADELYLSGVNGLGELFLKILHELEAALYENTQRSPQGLIVFNGAPDALGETVDLENFFSTSPFGVIAGRRPSFKTHGGALIGRWPASRDMPLQSTVLLGPAFAYASGLYLAEGGTPKSEIFAMFARKPEGLSLGFTSSEDVSVNLILRALMQVVTAAEALSAWKVKVGSQYFTELVVTGLKHGVPMLRGGASGDGKLRTMEISLAIKPWALTVCPTLERFADRYSHVEPTGSGVARVDFWASSTVARWVFPLMIYCVFGGAVKNPATEFYR
jgi:hypothetical protein